MPSIGGELYRSLLQKYESEIQQYKTTLMIYFENPVAISDHSDHILEMDEIVSKISCAYDKLQILEQMFRSSYSKL
ncbi:MAG: hypothetical protein CL470_08420 [Acidimicrobiaceae bacterium]|nr:hypothetical protein [Acidimicrobiaceae bacterium]|tara:strand:- start:191 stop:418 length:228 start_codon:yes stop_codon:yes gene_type:complete